MSRDARSQQRKPREDVDPHPYVSMQVDTARMSNKECQKLFQDRACFRCKKTGHFSKDCPLKPKGVFQGKQRAPVKSRPRVRTADTGGEEGDNEGEGSPDKETKDLPPAYAKKDLIAAIKKIKIEDCEELLDQCALDSDQDF
jgi:Zinc knuckle